MGYEPGDVVSGFTLPNANGGGEVSLDEVMTEVGAVVVFECNHCPYVVGSINRINKAAAKAEELGMGFVGINSNDPEVYPCLLYTSPSPRDLSTSRMPSSA